MMNFKSFYGESSSDTTKWVMTHRPAIKTVAKFLGVYWSKVGVTLRIHILQRRIKGGH